jgi:cob(I)alamin adenosyltransferase
MYKTRVSQDDYKRALEAAVREYEQASAEHRALETRIAQLKQSIATLTKLCGYEPTVQLGLTEACRMVLRNANRPLTALDVRERLVAVGVDMDRYSNALASIHNVLRRMHEAGEVTERERAEAEHAKTAYAYGIQMSASDLSGPRASSKRPTGEGLCPPKDRKK